MDARGAQALVERLALEQRRRDAAARTRGEQPVQTYVHERPRPLGSPGRGAGR